MIPLHTLRKTAAPYAQAPRPLTPAQQARNASILAGARAIFARHGLAPVSMQSLATALNVSATTLRRLHGDKPTLLLAILLDHLAGLDAALAAAPQTLPGLLHAHRTWIAEHAEGHVLLLRETITLPPELAADLGPLYRAIRARFAAALAATSAPNATTRLSEFIDLANNPTIGTATILARFTPPPREQAEPAPRPTIVPAAVLPSAQPRPPCHAIPDRLAA